MDLASQPPLFASLSEAQTALVYNWRWPHFSISELACRCQGRFCKTEYWHDPVFLDALEMLRAKAGRPLLINSGHRDALWNAFVGGAAKSMHKTIAVDISLTGHDRKALLQAAKETGFTGFGLGRTFLHIDRRVRPAYWFYKGSSGLWRI